ncbi:hypothetical protein CapIbe_011208 [Capra ibex]
MNLHEKDEQNESFQTVLSTDALQKDVTQADGSQKKRPTEDEHLSGKRAFQELLSVPWEVTTEHAWRSLCYPIPP